MKKNQQTSSLHLFMEEFGKESDRAKVILSAAMLDEALYALLSAHLVPNSSSSDSLFDGPNSPLSSFSSRIEFAFRVGLISKRFARDLHIIRRIRNEFAHNVSGCTFESSNVANRVSALKGSFEYLIKKEEEKKGERIGHVDVFETVVSWAIWYLWGHSEEIKSQRECEEEWGYGTQAEIETPNKSCNTGPEVASS